MCFFADVWPNRWDMQSKHGVNISHFQYKMDFIDRVVVTAAYSGDTKKTFGSYKWFYDTTRATRMLLFFFFLNECLISDAVKCIWMIYAMTEVLAKKILRFLGARTAMMCIYTCWILLQFQGRMYPKMGHFKCNMTFRRKTFFIGPKTFEIVNKTHLLFWIF